MQNSSTLANLLQIYVRVQEKKNRKYDGADLYQAPALLSFHFEAELVDIIALRNLPILWNGCFKAYFDDSELCHYYKVIFQFKLQTLYSLYDHMSPVVANVLITLNLKLYIFHSLHFKWLHIIYCFEVNFLTIKIYLK